MLEAAVRSFSGPLGTRRKQAGAHQVRHPLSRIQPQKLPRHVEPFAKFGYHGCEIYTRVQVCACTGLCLDRSLLVQVTACTGLCLDRSLLVQVTARTGLCLYRSLLVQVTACTGLCLDRSLLVQVSACTGLCFYRSLLDLIDYMERDFSRVSDSCLSIQVVPCPLKNPKVLCHIHIRSPPSHWNPVHTFTPYFFKIFFFF